MSTGEAIQTIRAWHDAVNAGDVARVVAHVTPDVAFVGPRGTSTGVQVLEDWVKRAGIRIVPVAWYAGGDKVVVEQESAWMDASTGAMTEPKLVATSFTVTGGRVSRLARYDTTADALADAGLTAADGVSCDSAFLD